MKPNHTFKCKTIIHMALETSILSPNLLSAESWEDMKIQVADHKPHLFPMAAVAASVLMRGYLSPKDHIGNTYTQRMPRSIAHE